MTEPDRTNVDEVVGSGAGEPMASELDKALESLKQIRDGADDHRVTSDGHARMSWSSVTEADPDEAEPAESGPSPAEDEPSFRFDLGSALARLGGEQPTVTDAADDTLLDEPAAPDSLPTASVAPALDGSPPEFPDGDQLAAAPPSEPPSEPVGDLPTRAPVANLPTRRPTVEPSPGTPPPSTLPRRGAPPVDDPYPSSLPQRSREADVPPSSGTDVPAGAPPTEPPVRSSTAAANRSVFEDAAPAPALPATPQRMPSVEPTPPVIPPGALPNLPTLPPAAPPTVTVITEPTSIGPTTPDLNAVRSYQLRAQREQRRSKVFGRTLLVVVLLGAAVAAALVFGRSYLYPTEWDAALTPIVDDVQEAHGATFGNEVPLQTLPNAEYAALVLGLTFGDDWADRLPEWRALGVASGPATSADEAVIAWRPAIYDPATDTLYRAEEADPAAADIALRTALEEVFARQHGTPPNDRFEGTAIGVVGVSSLERINSMAIDRALLGAGGTATVSTGTSAPLPMLYEFDAIDTLGQPLMQVAGPAAAGWSYGDVYPAEVLSATEVPRTRAISMPPPADAESLADPVALGPDNWALIWAGRLPDSTVDRLITIVRADSYRPVLRGGVRCFVADLQVASDANANELLGAMARWVAAGPPTANGSATLVSPTVVEVVACDPGAETEIAVDPGAVGDLLARQQARL